MRFFGTALDKVVEMLEALLLEMDQGGVEVILLEVERE